jgi:hypothetical protein
MEWRCFAGATSDLPVFANSKVGANQELDWESEPDGMGVCTEPNSRIEAGCNGSNAATKAPDCSTPADF